VSREDCLEECFYQCMNECPETEDGYSEMSETACEMYCKEEGEKMCSKVGVK